MSNKIDVIVNILFTILFALVCLLVVLLIVWLICVIKERTHVKTKTKAAKETFLKFNSWWVDSKFNRFVVVDKRVPFGSSRKRYLVIKQETTGKYFEREVDVNTYYTFEKGDYLKYSRADRELITYEDINTYNKETLSTLTLLDAFFAASVFGENS